MWATRIYYNDIDITAYVHSYMLDAVINQIIVNHLAITDNTARTILGLAKWRLPMQGWWHSVFDGLTMPNVLIGVPAPVRIELTDYLGREVVYAWATAHIMRAAIKADLRSAIDWDYELVLSGAPTRGHNPWAGAMQAVLLWDGAHVLRTLDIQEASPVWALVDSGVTGTIYDAQAVIVSDTVIGAWLLTADGVWWCGDLYAATPSWALKLAIATVQAADAGVSGGTILLHALAAGEPGYCIVASGPLNLATTGAFVYNHSYTWHTHNYGATWTQVDMAAYTVEVSSYVAGYCGIGRYGLAILTGESPVIWAARTTPTLQDKSALFKSTDLGDTWSREYQIADYSGDVGSGMGLRAPGALAERSYLNRGNNLSGVFGWLYTSDDAWASGTQQTKPAGYSGTAFKWRPAGHQDDPNFVLTWWRHAGEGQDHLLKSTDGGLTWTDLYDGEATSGRWNSPVGWPGDLDTWLLVKTQVTTGINTVFYTADHFANVVSKQGNLPAVLGSWTTGDAHAIALPKVAA